MSTTTKTYSSVRAEARLTVEFSAATRRIRLHTISARLQNISLLVGKRENCPPPPLASDKTLTADPSNTTEEQLADMKKPVNWLRGESRWIVIGSQSARGDDRKCVSSIANVVMTTLSDIDATLEPLRSAQIFMAREFVKEMETTGREIAISR